MMLRSGIMGGIMNIKSTIKMALQSVSSNKMRTFLTMLGIIIGVFSVIVLISIGEGSAAGIRERIESMGSNTIEVYIYSQDKSMDYTKIKGIETLEGISKVTPIFNSRSKVKYRLNSGDVDIKGVNENFIGINNYTVGSGRGISPIDIEARNKIAVIGTKTGENLFGMENPLGKDISINGEKYTVVGVLENKSGSIYGDSNDIILVPFNTIMRQLKSNNINNFTIQADSTEMSKIATENIKKYLLDFFKDENIYNVFNQDEMLDTIDESNKMMTTMLGGIAGISLLVGGIGIMNIMLVTVTERTREIGIRKAIGAGRGSILFQFLIEACIISGMGGAIGVILGIIGSKVIINFMGFTHILNISIIIAALSFSLVVGIFFGIYPANKASKLKPIDALRFE